MDYTGRKQFRAATQELAQKRRGEISRSAKLPFGATVTKTQQWHSEGGGTWLGRWVRK